MSYENKICPCGGKKKPDTMFCDKCQEYLADRPEMRTMLDTKADTDVRRHAGIILLSLAKRRRG